MTIEAFDYSDKMSLVRQLLPVEVLAQPAALQLDIELQNHDRLLVQQEDLWHCNPAHREFRNSGQRNPGQKLNP